MMMQLARQVMRIVDFASPVVVFSGLGFAFLLIGCKTEPSPSLLPSSSAPTSMATGTAQPSPSLAQRGFYCFTWVHREGSTDCYRDSVTCEREQKEMDAAGTTAATPCRSADHAWCTRVTRPPTSFDQERCFGSALDCALYQSMVNDRGLQTTPCIQQ